MFAWWCCTITRPTPMTTWRPWLSATQSTSTRTLECALSCSSCVSASSYIAHAPHGASPSCVRHFIVIHMRSWCVPFSLPIDLSILFILYLSHLLSHSFHFFTHFEVRRQPSHSAQREFGFHWWDPLPHWFWAQRLTPTQSSWPRRRSSPKKCFPRTPSTMTPPSRVCCVKLTEYIAITLNENTSLSVCRRLCPKERCDLLEKERGDLLSVVVGMHILELCWTDKTSEFLPSARLNKDMNFKLKNFNDEINSFFMDNYCSKIWNYVKLIRKISVKWEEFEKFQSSTFDTFASSGRIQDLQSEINCIRIGSSHVTSRPVSFSPHPIPEGMLRHSFITPSRREGPPTIWDTSGLSGNVFANPHASSSAPYPQELNPWNSSIEEPLHSSTVEVWKARTKSRSEMPVWTVSQRFSHLQWKRLSKELWSRPTTTADFRSSFWYMHHTINVCLLEDKIQDLSMYLFTISYGIFAMDQRSGDGWFSGWCKHLRHQ